MCKKKLSSSPAKMTREGWRGCHSHADLQRKRKKSMKEDGRKEEEKKQTMISNPNTTQYQEKRWSQTLRCKPHHLDIIPPVVHITGERNRKEDQEDGTETQHPAISQNNILPSEEERLVSPFLCSKQHTKQPEMKRKRKTEKRSPKSPAHAPTMTTDPFLCAHPVLCSADALHPSRRPDQ